MDFVSKLTHGFVPIPFDRYDVKMSASDTLRLAPCLTPHGRLLLAPDDDAPELEAAFARRLERAFARGAGHGLLTLGGAEVGQVLPPIFAYWRLRRVHEQDLIAKAGRGSRLSKSGPPAEKV